MRAMLVRLHRWAGLAIAGFLIVVGLTGGVLAFYPDLNHWLTPELFPGPHPGKEFPLGALAQRAEELVPDSRVSSVFTGYAGTAMIEVEARPGQPELDFSRIYLDPVTGAELGRVNWGAFPTDRATILPFIYSLHYSLAAGETGSWLLGIVALIWTIDCFVSFLVTLPPRSARSQKSFLARWIPSWRIKSGGSFYRAAFDVHRAGGLWLWAMLFVFAWSSVYWNLTSVYVAVMDSLLGFSPPLWARPAPEAPAHRGAIMTWEKAQSVAEKLMAEQAHIHGFSIARPVGLNLMHDRTVFSYDVMSSRDVADTYGATSIAFDAVGGAMLHATIPTGFRAGNTITTWLGSLHMADVFGLPYKAFVSCFGAFVATLSATGVYIWWRKRKARAGRSNCSAPVSTSAERIL